MKTDSALNATGLKTSSKLHKPFKRFYKSSVTQEESVQDISVQVSHLLINFASGVSGQKEDNSDQVKVNQVSYPNNYSRERVFNEASEIEIFSATTVSFLNGLVLFEM